MKMEFVPSRGKSLRLEVRGDGRVVVRVPKGVTEKQAQAFVNDNEAWIAKAQARLNEKCVALENVQKAVDLEALWAQASIELPARVEKWAKTLGVHYKDVYIKYQRTRWGSCSNLGNINLNALLLLAPEEVRDYVVVHELCHLLEMNHSPSFWANVEQTLPDYRKQKQWLKENGAVLMALLN